MIDIKLIRQNKKKIEALIQTKEPHLNLDNVVALDETIRHLKTEVEKLKAERNALSKQVGEKKHQEQEAKELKEQVRRVGEKISALDGELVMAEQAFTKELSLIPNIPFEEVKVSQNKEDNVLIKTVGKKPQFPFTPKHHVELNTKLELFDFHRTAKTSGTGWPAYRGMGARLEWALLSYMIDIQIKNGFEFWLPPLLVRPQTFFHSGQLPKFEGQFYKVHGDTKEQELYLVPTSEIVLNGLHAEEIMDEELLPLKYVAYTPCFRKEAGAAGANERGLIRVHQFNKVEMFCFCSPSKVRSFLI